MVRKYSFFFMVTVIILGAGFLYSQDFKAGSEPEGFRGMLWGTDLSALHEMRFVMSRDIGGSLPESLWDFERGAFKKQIKVDIYERPGDDLHLYGASVKSVSYGFCREKLCEITVIARDEDNWRVLKDGVFEQFGKGVKQPLPPSKLGDEGPDWYTWMGNFAEMELIYIPLSQSTRFWIGSTVVRDQVFKDAIE